MSEKFKKQHIVPQSYLKRFALFKRDETYVMGTRLCSPKMKTPKFFKSSTADVAYRNNYYDTCAQRDKKFWEHYMDDNFDTLCGKPLGSIISSLRLSMPEKKVLNDAQKDILARIIVSQSIRVPTFFEKQVARSEQLLCKYKADILSQISDQYTDKIELIEKIEFSTDDRKNIVFEAMFDKRRFEKFCTLLREKIWIVYYNGIRDTLPFVTSDNPVVFAEIGAQNQELTKIGLMNDRLVILYPIAPDLLIGIYSPNLFFGKSDFYDSVLKVVKEEKFITRCNTKVIKQSYVHSFLPDPIYSLLEPSKEN